MAQIHILVAADAATASYAPFAWMDGKLPAPVFEVVPPQPEALCQALAQRAFDLLLLDCHGTPDLDLVRQIHHTVSHLPLLVVGEDESRDLDEAVLEAGATCYTVRTQFTPYWLSRFLQVVLGYQRRLQAEGARAQTAEVRYLALMESSPNGILIHDGQRVHYANRAVIQLLGAHDQDQVVGSDPLELVHPDHRNRARERIQHILSTGQYAPPREFQWLRPDGGTIDLEVTGLPTTWDGAPGILLVLRDFSERKQAEADLRQAHQELNMTLDRISDVVMAVDAGWRLIYINRRGAVVLGLDVASVVGRSLWDVFPQLRGSIYETSYRQAMAEQTIVRFEAPSVVIDRRYAVTVYPSAEGLSIYAQDITEQARLAAALRESEENFRVALKYSPITTARVDRDLRFTWIYNPPPSIEPENLLGKRLDEVPFGAAGKRLYELQREVLQTGQGARHEYTVTLAGRRYNYDLTLEPYRDAAGEVVGVTLAAMEITAYKQAVETLRQTQAELERRVAARTRALAAANRRLQEEIVQHRQTEEQLRRSEIHLNEAQHVAGIGSWEWDIRSNTVHWSESLYRIHGLPTTPESGSFEQISRYIHPEDVPRIRSQVQHALQERRPLSIEYRIVLPDGSIRCLHGIGKIVTDKADQPVQMLGTVQDITARKQMEAEVQEMRRLLDKSREVERLRLARELHDGPLQEVVALNLELALLAREIEDEPNAEHLTNLSRQVAQIVRHLRTVAQDLRPPLLMHVGLAAAIRAHAYQLQELATTPAITLALDEACPHQPEETALALFRIYQQALRNAVQHAAADQIDVRLSCTPESLQLEIQDNGRGFTLPNHWVELARQGRWGLVGMVERAEGVGGHLQITSAPDAGTTVRVWVPTAGDTHATAGEQDTQRLPPT